MTIETSKLILGVSWAVALTLTAITIDGSYKGIDMTVVGTLTGFAWVEVATATGFYYWKARTENRAKYAHKFVLDFADKYGVDAAIRIAEVVLKD